MSIFKTKKEESQYLANWCIEIIKFYDSIQADPLKDEWIDKMLDGIKENDVVGLRMAYNDMLENTKDLLPEQYKTIDNLLRQKFGHGLKEADQKYTARMLKILAKGRLKNLEQYYLLREYYERIWDETLQNETTKKIQALLLDFEQQTSAKQKTIKT